MKIKVIIEKTNTGFSASALDIPAFTTASNFESLISNMIEAINLYFKAERLHKRVGRTDIDLMLNYEGYLASVNFDFEEKNFHGKIADIGDLVTFEARTETKLLLEFERAVDDYLKTCKTVGKNPE